MKKVISIILSIAIMLPCLGINAYADMSATMNARYERKMRLVTELFREDKETLEAVEACGRAVVFISVSDTMNQAKTVYSSTGGDLDAALNKAFQKARLTGVNPVWFKLDVVTEIEEISYKDFTAAYAGKLGNSMRKGIAFNSYFGRALLEAQINSSGYLNYETGELDLDAINKYFKKTKKKPLAEIPETLYLFKTKGYFSDTPAGAHDLYDSEYAAFGTRKYDYSPATIEKLAGKTSRYLADMVNEEGKFVYGYYPIDNEELEGYNIIRHAGTTWNLILQYEMTGDKSLIAPIDRALSYLDTYLHYKDNNTAFLNDRGTLNVGGNGISLLAYVCYAEIMKSDKYNDTIKALANGIIYMQKEDGGYIHTLRKADYSVYKEYIVVFYDGEATYGLLKAYGLLGTKKYLRAAEKAADYFIANNYEELHSHWIAYSFNELTKYTPKEEYFNFGLLNVHGYTDKVHRTVSAAHTACETMGATFELYVRMKELGIECDILDDFDEEMLFKAFSRRVKYGLHYFIQPEQAMYFVNPRLVLNSFVVREDAFRIRIDDIQHFMGGYYLYWKNYEALQKYLNQE